jgi:hypothetical protein
MSSLAAGFRTCPSCGGHAPISSFDLAVTTGGDERSFFGVPAAACRACGRLVLDRELELLFGITVADVVGAIQSDTCLRGERGMDAA